MFRATDTHFRDPREQTPAPYAPLVNSDGTPVDMGTDGAWRISGNSGTFSKASRYKGFSLTKKDSELEPSPASYKAELCLHKLKAKACATKMFKPTIDKEAIYECVGNTKILQKNYMNKKQKQTLIAEQMYYLHANPLKKNKISESLLYQRARTLHHNSLSGILKWQETTQQTSPDPNQRHIWENPNLRKQKAFELVNSLHKSETEPNEFDKSFRGKQHRAQSARANLLERMIANKAQKSGINFSSAGEEYLLTPANKRLLNRPQTSKGYSASNRTTNITPNRTFSTFKGANTTEQDLFTSDRSASNSHLNNPHFIANKTNKFARDQSNFSATLEPRQQKKMKLNQFPPDMRGIVADVCKKNKHDQTKSPISNFKTFDAMSNDSKSPNQKVYYNMPTNNDCDFLSNRTKTTISSQGGTKKRKLRKAIQNNISHLMSTTKSGKRVDKGKQYLREILLTNTLVQQNVQAVEDSQEN